MRERGLKSSVVVFSLVTILVAPYAGAWIEIKKVSDSTFYKMVAPYAGAWIEIQKFVKAHPAATSRSLCGSVD